MREVLWSTASSPVVEQGSSPVCVKVVALVLLWLPVLLELFDIYCAQSVAGVALGSTVVEPGVA